MLVARLILLSTFLFPACLEEDGLFPAGMGHLRESKANKAFEERYRKPMEKILGWKFSEPVRFLPIAPEEMAELIGRENASLEAKLIGEEPDEERIAEFITGSRPIAGMVLAKFSLQDGLIRTVPENFTRMAKLSDEMAGLTEEKFAHVILIHEAVHLHQEKTVGLRKFFEGAANPHEFMVRQCVSEGHAQWVTRQVCQEVGLQKEFELFRSINSSVPGSVKEESARGALQIFVQMVGFPYTQGEKFFAGVVDKVGIEKALELVYGKPPRSIAEVTSVKGYLRGK